MRREPGSTTTATVYGAWVPPAAAVRIFDLAGACGYDLEDIILRKLSYNLKREDHTLEHRAGENGKRE
jgi:hypothetical protein